jgi:hypothetical protein
MRVPNRQILPLIALIAGSLLLTGCGKPKRVPVKGTIMRGAEPLTTGAVCFEPDASKGNTAQVSCIGMPGKNGDFNLVTRAIYGPDSGPGVPPGWYRVRIKTNVPGQPPIDTIDPKYTSFDTTPWLVEVVANPEPDRYNFVMEK